MYPGAWRKIKDKIAIWRVGTLPGMVIIALVIILRLTGAIQSLEWLAFDNFLRIRPEEPRDERILLVGINEDDIRSWQNYPISDRDLATLLLKLQSYNPRVIGVDIYRDLPVVPGHTELVAAFSKIPNLIAIEKVLPEKIAPPLALPPEKLGFADQILDNDGKLRRILLGTPTPEAYKLSLSLRLAKAYLADEGVNLENGIRDRATMRFGNTELPRFLPNAGGYVGTDAGGVQALLNFRSGEERFRILSLRDITSNNFNPDWIRDRIVIIGITAPSRKDFITTAGVISSKPAKGRVYGLEIQAHTVSQIISAVLDSRPLLKTWDDIWEYLWIIAWGLLGIIIAGLTKLPLTNLAFFSLATSSLVVCSYFLLNWGLWVPVIPAALVLALNSIELTALYQYDFALRSGIQVRQAIIERTFETIHNGPLQSLAQVLKLVRSQDLPIDELLPELEQEIEKLNHELRGIYEFLQHEPLTQDNSLYLGNSLILNLKDPVHEILYQVYSYTLDRDLPYFKTIRVKIRTFEPMDERGFNIEVKRGLCRFLEEALCNVGKHATGVTRLEVTCSASEGWYTLSIIDDGLGTNSCKEGRGTQQFRNLQRQLKGKFRQVVLSPKGYLCELSWTASKCWWR
ncbi:MAG TPA: CHASE2 domain-containing protein [Nodularia sp. (in: cyanobacteria)]|nr:CHASE2 domain-containing protein [Nodularia sp. (in: cyanobacteria)]